MRRASVLMGPTPPRLAILDWSMPGADGIALCHEIRATPSLRTMYVVLLTARDRLDEMVSGLEQGADEYIVKPFDWDVLRARLHWAARGSRCCSKAWRSGSPNCRRPGDGEAAVRAAADLRVLQAHPPRRQLLAATRDLRRRALRGGFQPRHLPAVPREGQTGVRTLVAADLGFPRGHASARRRPWRVDGCRLEKQHRRRHTRGSFSRRLGCNGANLAYGC